MEISFSLFLFVFLFYYNYYYFDIVLLNGKFPRGRENRDFPSWPSSSWGSGAVGGGCLISFPLSGRKQLPLTWDIMIQLARTGDVLQGVTPCLSGVLLPEGSTCEIYPTPPTFWGPLGGCHPNWWRPSQRVSPHGAPGPLHRAWSEGWGHHATRTKQSHGPSLSPCSPKCSILCQQCPPCHRDCLKAGSEQSQWTRVPLSFSPWQTTPVTLSSEYLRCFSQQLPMYPRKIFSLHLFKSGHHLGHNMK